MDGRDSKHHQGYHCTPQSFMGETPFYLTYCTDAIIPLELGEVSWRRSNFEEEYNSDNLRADLDLIHDIREEARVRKEAAKSRTTCWYNSLLILA